jgi:hypothetical protein
VTKAVQTPTSHLESKAKGEEGERKEERSRRGKKSYIAKQSVGSHDTLT